MATKFFMKRESVSPSLLDSERQSSDAAFVPLTNHAIMAIVKKDETIFGINGLGLAIGKYATEVRDFIGPAGVPVAAHCRSWPLPALPVAGFVGGRAVNAFLISCKKEKRGK